MGNKIFYFRYTESGVRLLNLLMLLNIIKAPITQLENSYLYMKTETGESLHTVVLRHINLICKKIGKDVFENPSSLIEHLNTKYCRKRVRMFLEKKITHEIRDKVIFLTTVDYLMKNNTNGAVLIENDNWSKYYKLLPLSSNVCVEIYRIPMKNTAILLLMMMYEFARTLLELSRIVFSINKIINREKNKTPMIAVPFSSLDINLNPKKKNDYFWFIDSKIDPKELLLYFFYTHRPLNSEMVKLLNKYNIKYVAIKKDATTVDNALLWEKTAYYYYLLFKSSLSLFYLGIKALNNYNYTVGWQFKNLIQLFRGVSFWEDFYRYNNVKIHCSLFEVVSEDMEIALNSLQNISIGYHYASPPMGSVFQESVVDVYLIWGPYYKNIYYNVIKRKPHGTQHDIIYTGYIYDYTFKHLYKNSVRLKSKLNNKGVKFIISLFSENLGESNWRNHAIDIYYQFLKEAMTDKSLGIIIKPKPRKNTKKILMESKKLNAFLNTLINEGRLVFLDGDSFPNEASQASDLAVGFYENSTTAVEAFLADTPSVTIHSLGTQNNHKGWKNRILFDDTNCLIASIKNSRKNSNISKEIGDYSFVIDKIDPFRDGKAYLRIGEYIRCLLDQVKKGSSKEETIRFATNFYKNKYGADKIDHFEE